MLRQLMMSKWVRWLLGITVIVMLLRWHYVSLIPSDQPVPISAFSRPELRVSNGSIFSATFPRLVHVMWKNQQRPPPETVHWQSGCKRINEDMKVLEYNDDDLLKFTTQNYPEYLPLFSKLKGVHMADMARVLVTYHFGGLYMDLDFYCVRPFRCLHQFLPPDVKPSDDILIVSLETRMHATVFREKERVVIQDFFYATPRHPFFRYMLDDRMAKFNLDREHHAKGPFGYHIEEDIDAFWRSPAGASGGRGSGEAGKKTVIYELRDDVLHSLGDATHSKLGGKCFVEPSTIPAVSAQSCEHVRRSQFFQPSRNTVAVHMWFHTYLGWHLIRGYRNKAAYAQVERSLPQTPQC